MEVRNTGKIVKDLQANPNPDDPYAVDYWLDYQRGLDAIMDFFTKMSEQAARAKADGTKHAYENFIKEFF